MRYRIYLDSCSRKATHIVDSKADAEKLLPKHRSCTVKVFTGRTLCADYLVSWLGDHYKWDRCYSISD